MTKEWHVAYYYINMAIILWFVSSRLQLNKHYCSTITILYYTRTIHKDLLPKNSFCCASSSWFEGSTYVPVSFIVCMFMFKWFAPLPLHLLPSSSQCLLCVVHVSGVAHTTSTSLFDDKTTYDHGENTDSDTTSSTSTSSGGGSMDMDRRQAMQTSGAAAAICFSLWCQYMISTTWIQWVVWCDSLLLAACRNNPPFCLVPPFRDEPPSPTPSCLRLSNTYIVPALHLHVGLGSDSDCALMILAPSSWPCMADSLGHIDGQSWILGGHHNDNIARQVVFFRWMASSCLPKLYSNLPLRLACCLLSAKTFFSDDDGGGRCWGATVLGYYCCFDSEINKKVSESCPFGRGGVLVLWQESENSGNESSRSLPVVSCLSWYHSTSACQAIHYLR
jgi:hypothetical protein